MLAVYTYSNDIYSLAWGVVLSRVIGLSRTSKTDNPNSLTLSFLYKPFLLGLGKQICDIMKRILLPLVGAVMALSMFAQKLTSVRSFEYLDYVTPHPYDVRKATLGGESLTISYNPNTGYGIKFRYIFRNINISVKFITSGNGKYIYTGTDSSGNKTVVATKRKLSDFLDNVGQTQSESFERDKEIEIAIYGIGDLSIYPLKNTPERRKEKEERSIKIKERNRLQDKLNELYSYWQSTKASVQDSLRNSFKKEFFEKKGAGRYSWDSETNFAVRYMACIDSNKVVKILKINDVKVAENIEYLDEFNRNEYKYQAKNNNGAKLINGKMFLTDRFSPNLIVCTLTREIVLKKGKVLYTRWGSGKVSQKAEKVIEANIALLKKGRYLIEIQELDGELISVVAQKYSNISNKKEIVLYSIYE